MNRSKMESKLDDLESTLMEADNIFLQNIGLEESPQTHISEFVGLLEMTTAELPESEVQNAALIVELVTKALRRVCRLADMQLNTMAVEE